MTGFEWMLWMILVTFYLTCLFTVCMVTFRKGHTVLGVVGIFIPFLWLIGAVLPPKPGSRYDMEERARYA